MALIQIILALARTIVAARDHQLGKIRAEQPRTVIQNQGYLGKTDRSALGRAAEDDILHLRPAQRARGLLAQYPADGIRNIGFTRAVRPDDGSQTAEKTDLSLIRKGLKALQDQAF